MGSKALGPILGISNGGISDSGERGSFGEMGGPSVLQALGPGLCLSPQPVSQGLGIGECHRAGEGSFPSCPVFRDPPLGEDTAVAG